MTVKVRMKPCGIVSMPLVTASMVRQAAEILDNSKVMDKWRQWREDDGFSESRPGRPKFVEERTLIILMLILGIEGEPFHLTKARDIIVYRATEKALEELRLPQRHEWGFDRWNPRMEALWYERTYSAMQRLINVLDPFPGTSYRRRYTKDEFSHVVSQRDPALIRRRRQRCRDFFNPLILASARVLDEAFEKWRGDIAIDATPIPSFKIGTSRRSTHVSADPDAEWYVRHDKVLWARDLTMVCMTGDDFGRRGLPGLVLGMSLDKPAVDPSGNGLDALAHIVSDSSLPKRYAYGDQAYYPGADADKYQLPMRRAGYRVVGDLPKGRPGQPPELYNGAQLVDGAWYCPALPQGLRDVTAGETAESLRENPGAQKLLRRRIRYQLRIKEITPTGAIKMMCPARGPGATVTCPIADGAGTQPPAKATAMAGKSGGRRRPGIRPKGDAPASPPPSQASKYAIPPEHLPSVDHLPTICTNKCSMTIPAWVGAKFAQLGPAWATEGWERTYRSGRSGIESKNHHLKSRTGRALGDPTSRLVRGFAKQAVLITLGVVALNVVMISNYLRRTGTPGAVEHSPLDPDNREENYEDDGIELRRPNAPPTGE